MRAHRHFRVLLLFTLLIVLTPEAQASATAPRDPRLRLRPNDGPPGITVLARGRDFSPGTAGTLIWDADGAALADFTVDDEGEFEVAFVVPDAAPGAYSVTAQPDDGSEPATDAFEVEAPETTERPTDAAPPPAIAGVTLSPCPTEAARRIDVANAVDLTEALAGARPGDLIALADGVYAGTFVAAASGQENARITLCGSRKAIIDGGDWGNGYALHITGDYWTVQGLTITNALKGIMLDDADFTILHQVEVHTIGHEAVHFRANSSDNLIQESDIHDTGLKRDKFGEGIYIGSAVSNWPQHTGGEPDRSDRNQVLRNRIWNTTSESIDIKEGTTGGLIAGNLFDGSALTGADSWVDVKGSDYVIRDNSGINSPQDGFQTHVINGLPWGRNNLFEGNTAEVNGDGFGFYIHNPESSVNTVRCDNQVSAAASGFANVECA